MRGKARISPEAWGSRRELTAIRRAKLSMPARRALAELRDGDSLLDYGAGRGIDTDLLRKMRGETLVHSWDPYYAPGAPRPADVVLLSYVLNVIEDRAERDDVLRDAWGLAQRTLVVAVRQGGPATVAKFEPSGDGVITQAGTFQRYFRAAEFADYVTGVVKAPIRRLGPCVVGVDREP